MAGFLNAEKDRLIDLHLSGAYIGLLSAVSAGVSGTEVTGDAYARKAASGNIGASSGGAATNAAVIRWDSLDSSSSKTVAGVGIYSASTGGTLRAAIGLTGGSVSVSAGQPFEVPAGGADVTM